MTDNPYATANQAIVASDTATSSTADANNGAGAVQLTTQLETTTLPTLLPTLVSPKKRQIVIALIDDAERAWKFFSIWAMGMGIVCQTCWDAIPVDTRAQLPSNMQHYVTIALLVFGIIGRVIKQTESTPPANTPAVVTDNATTNSPAMGASYG